ncbi:hypothetical protein [Enterococcus pallens]|uniref:Uncharacterized protein n=1 Tax=Enterococcus pallens ATCC BAA-351 TaxID=1158607 RepID=R2SBH9_9ENTE|nr:hypothetical protein [Enterococcus pallens]EOH90211.1 hypothetical protein UAU_04040 [Enterococcus pallens ATCC BAA-351]EOU15183.1 hypothetical protein I588_04115 [Enterococcus pallens ATCC BAA-351]OJG79085.1 hypothetical protein RV10_GL000918 [Enterococcus pallens]
MNKRQKKKKAYKQYMHDIFEGYEKMLEDPKLPELTFPYLKEITILSRDSDGKIHFTTKEL